MLLAGKSMDCPTMLFAVDRGSPGQLHEGNDGQLLYRG